jgi:uncharacterized membrane protein YccC
MDKPAEPAVPRSDGDGPGNPSDGGRRGGIGDHVADFLRAELAASPSRRITALRIFTSLMLVALASVVSRPPPLTPLAFSIVISLGAGLLPATTLRAVANMVLHTLAVMVLALISLALWSDQPWFLVPWLVVVMTLQLVHARITGAPTVPLLFFANAVLYHPLQPTANVYTALWSVPIAGLACGAVALTHIALWPQDPRDALRLKMQERFEAIARILERLSRLAPDPERGSPPAAERPTAGGLSSRLRILAAAEAGKRPLRGNHESRVALIAELETWFQLAAWWEREFCQTHPGPALAPDQAERLRTLALHCRQMLDVYRMAPGAVPLRDAPIRALVPTDRLGVRVEVMLNRLEVLDDRVRDALVRLDETPPDQAGREVLAPAPGWLGLPSWLTHRFWAKNLATLQFSLKYTLGMLICMFLVQALNWPGLDTSMVTCLVIAQTSLGADYRKALLRICGAVFGGFLAYVFVIVEQPALETVAGFLLGIAPAVALTAWIASGGPRISYMGVQMGFAFAHVVLHGYGPVLDLALARDRVLGILLGIVVMGFLDYALWPQSSLSLARGRIARAARALADWLEAGAGVPGPNGSARLEPIDKDLLGALDLIDHARLEPGRDRTHAEPERVMLGAVTADLHGIGRLLFRRHRLAAIAESLPKPFRQQRDAHDRSLAESLRDVARDVEKGGAGRQVPRGDDDWSAEERISERLIQDLATENAQRDHLRNAVSSDRALRDYIRDVQLRLRNPLSLLN